MVIHLYKTSTPNKRKGAVDRQVKSNSRNNLIYRQHHCGKGRNTKGIITAGHRRGGYLYQVDLLRIRVIGLKREPKKDLSCIILHNLKCYQFCYVDQMIKYNKKFLDSWRYRTA